VLAPKQKQKGKGQSFSATPFAEGRKTHIGGRVKGESGLRADSILGGGNRETGIRIVDFNSDCFGGVFEKTRVGREGGGGEFKKGGKKSEGKGSGKYKGEASQQRKNRISLTARIIQKESGGKRIRDGTALEGHLRKQGESLPVPK